VDKRDVQKFEILPPTGTSDAEHIGRIWPAVALQSPMKRSGDRVGGGLRKVLETDRRLPGHGK
jgi:hypothetical protein